MGYDYSEINTDDFIALCREIGAEPFITINPCWNTPEENAAWVEYCNGGSSTPYGKLRAQRATKILTMCSFGPWATNSVTATWRATTPPVGTAEVALEHGKKMLEASPNLSLCSSGPYPNKEWSELSAKPLAGISQMISAALLRLCTPHYTDLAT